MDQTQNERLEAAGYKIGTVAEFLGLTPEENDIVEATYKTFLDKKAEDESLAISPKSRSAKLKTVKRVLSHTGI